MGANYLLALFQQNWWVQLGLFGCSCTHWLILTTPLFKCELDDIDMQQEKLMYLCHSKLCSETFERVFLGLKWPSKYSFCSSAMYYFIAKILYKIKSCNLVGSLRPCKILTFQNKYKRWNIGFVLVIVNYHCR